MIGAGEPALPGVAIGHNQHVGWGITIFAVDQQDLYVETVDPADPLRYKTEKGWERMRVENEEIRIKGRSPLNVQIKFTRHGPVLWEDPPRRPRAGPAVGGSGARHGRLPALARP